MKKVAHHFYPLLIMIERFAPAKLNLCLHVTGQRKDGYHELDSLVLHLDQGDWISVELADDISLSLSGEFCEGVPVDGRNLVLKAAHLLTEKAHGYAGAKLSLIKNLPSAAGIGGGSSDAAAALHLLSRLWNIPLPDDVTLALLAQMYLYRCLLSFHVWQGLVNASPVLENLLS